MEGKVEEGRSGMKKLGRKRQVYADWGKGKGKGKRKGRILYHNNNILKIALKCQHILPGQWSLSKQDSTEPRETPTTARMKTD